MAFSPLIPKPDSGLPSASISLASPNNGLIPVEDQSTRIRLAYENEAYEVEKEGQPHTSDIVNKGNVTSAARSLEIKREGARIPCSHVGPITHQATDISHPMVKIGGGEDELLIEAVGTHEHSDECFTKDMGLAHRGSDEFKPPNVAEVQFQWPDQKAVGNS